MSTVMLFYKNIVPLSREEHKELKFSQSKDSSFAQHTHWVPLSGEEFYRAALSYPIVFIGSENKDGKMSYTSVALLGLSNNKNDFIREDKSWEADQYIPAFVRRYPFVLAGDADQEVLSVCIDKDSGMFNTVSGINLFNEDGTSSAFLDQRITFLNQFKSSMEQTSKFIDLLTKMDLLTKESVNIQNTTGQNAILNDFWIVDEEKFRKLKGYDLEKLHKKGALGWIFSHLMSINNLPLLLNRLVKNQRNDNSENADTKVEKKSSSKKTS
ncbi:SapC family protein [Bartonella tamiae]|uniref:SapC family protein n=1 Tax=Bartonella tamiae Th239 TaxID=1094558 RepID=J0QZE9_9HYPH|nr:SapC family protein [Bartonella tamiae]EJF91516.1 hypothetical protein ME5_00211 [Bartonella tamiae Th239]EJF92500.1 hypothetical protein MEG_01670 [Bartonella tamiae Th307]